MASMVPRTQVFTGRTPGQGEVDITNALGRAFYAPDAENAKRVARYIEAERTLDPNTHLEAYHKQRPGSVEPETDQFWIPLDFLGMFGRLMRDYTIGEEFRITATPDGVDLSSGVIAEAQANVDRIVKNTKLEQILKQTAEALPTFGDAVLRLDIDTIDKTPQAVLRYIKPTHYFPQLNPLDQTRVDEVTLAWLFPAVSGAVTTRTRDDMVVLREMHSPGNIGYKLNQWDGKELGKELVVTSMFPDLEDRETGIDEIPIIHIGFQTKAGQHFGESEALRVAPLVYSLENRLTQEDEVLEKHARPKLIVGPGILDEDGRANLRDFDVIEVTPDIFEKAVRPEYLTWNSQLQGVGHEIEKLEEYIFMITETSPASFGLERDGSQVESARALRFKSHRTVSKVNDIRGGLRDDIDDIMRIAQKLELAALRAEDGAGYTRTEVVTKFGDPIVEDQTQEVEDMVARKNAGLVSRRRAVMDLDDLTPAQTEAETREILQDMVDESAAMTATFAGSPANVDTAGADPAVADALTPAGEEPAAPVDVSGDEGVGLQEGVQATLLNGAQITAMVGLVTAVASGSLPRESGSEILQTGFGLSSEEANQILGPESFTPPEAPPSVEVERSAAVTSGS